MRPLMPLHRRLYYVVVPHKKGLIIASVAVFGLSALMMLTRDFDGTNGLGSALYMLTVAFSIILSAGIVADEMSTGVMQLWLQRPVDPARHYLRRLGEALLAFGVLLTLIVLASRLLAGAAGWGEPDKLLTVLPRLLLEGCALSCVAFGASAWLQRGAAIVTMATLFGGFFVENTLAVQTDLLGFWNSVVRAFLHPDSAFREVAAFGTGQGDDILLPVARVLAYSAAWVLIGVVGATRGARNGGVARAQAE